MSTVKEALAEAKRIQEQYRDLHSDERSAVVREAEWAMRALKDYETRSQVAGADQAALNAELRIAGERHRDLEFRSYLMGYRPAGLVETSGVTLSDVERRDLGVGTNAGGGFEVAQAFSSRLAKAMAFWSAMEQASPPVKTATGAPMPQAAYDDSGSSGAILAENTVVTAPSDPTFTSRTLSAFDYVSPLVKWSLQLATDAGPWDDGSLEDQIAWLCGQRLGRIMNTHFTTGTGTTLPLGLFTSQAVTAGVVVGATSAAPTVVSLADLVALYGSLDEAYSPNAKFMIGPATRTALRALVGTDGLPVFPAHLPLTLFGHDVIVNPAIPAVASTSFSAAYGDFQRGYTIRSVGEPSFHVLRERFMDGLALGGFTYVRRDGQPSGDFRAVKLLQQHV